MKTFLRTVAYLLLVTRLAFFVPLVVVSGDLVAASLENNNEILTDVERAEQLNQSAPKEAEININPHWDKTQCKSCHLRDAKNGDLALRSTNDKVLCMRCHTEDVVHKYIHPVGIEISAKEFAKINEKWNGMLRLDKTNRLTCLICHDLVSQCLPGRSYMK